MGAVEREKADQSQYSFVLVTRDDDHWLAPLDLPSFATDPTFFSHTLYYKNCKTWGGVNDKTLLFGRAAAERILFRIYTDFWSHNDNESIGSTLNAEMTLKLYALREGVRLLPVDFSRIPTMDSVYMQVGARTWLCQKPGYACVTHWQFGCLFEAP